MDRAGDDGDSSLSPGGLTTPVGAELVPRRFYWLKRILFLAVSLVVGLALLRFWWGFEADRRLRAEIERYRVAGQPVYAREFDEELDAVADDQNAAILFEQAMAGITAETDSGVHFETLLAEREAFDRNMSGAAELVGLNTHVLALVRQAREKPQVAWSTRLQGFPTTFTPGLFGSQRALTKLLWVAATYRFRTGDHAEAVETLHDLLSLNDAIGSHPNLIPSLVAWACHNLMFTLVEDFGAELNITPAKSKSTTESKAAMRLRVEELIVRLLDDTDSGRASIRASYGERAYNLEFINSFNDTGWAAMRGTPLQPPGMLKRFTNSLQRPMVVLDTIRCMKLNSLRAEALAEDNWPAATGHFPTKAEHESLLRSLSRPLTVFWPWGSAYGSTARSVQIHYQYLARRRMAGTALAIRLYVIDHGRRPEQLSALVPKYLPVVPVDPFSAQPASIRYRPDIERPMLYSVGYDGQDDDGTVIILKDGRRDREEKDDIVFYLEGKPRPEPDGNSSSLLKTRENDRDGKNGQGEPDKSQAGNSQPQAGQTDRKPKRPAS